MTLHGTHVRLEPLSLDHTAALAEAAAEDPTLYRWTTVPQGREAMEAYIRAALEQREAGKAAPFATVRLADGAVVGSTRFFDLECWPWPEGHARHGRTTPDACEIGYTWLRASAIRTAANTEAKRLMLGHAFETWGAVRVCLHTDERNSRSRKAIGRLGAKFEGILRGHRMASDFVVRNSARYSILAEEWPEVRQQLDARMRKAAASRQRPASSFQPPAASVQLPATRNQQPVTRNCF